MSLEARFAGYIPRAGNFGGAPEVLLLLHLRNV